MSVQAIAWVLEEERRTKGATRLVLLALANHAGERKDGGSECWPSLATIAREANLSKTEVVRKALRELEGLGLIETRTKGAPDQRIPLDRRPNLYVLTYRIDPPQTGGSLATDDPPREGDRPPSEWGVATPLRMEDDPPREGGETVIKPSVEPSENLSLDSHSLVIAHPADEAPLDLHRGGAVDRKRFDVMRAQSVLNEWWERQTPRPAQPYIACQKVVSSMLKAGWSGDDVRYALDESPVVSTGALTFALRMRAKGRAKVPTEQFLGALVKLDGMTEDEQERWWNEEGPGRLTHG